MKISEFKDVLSLATKELHFLFNNILYKDIDTVAIKSLIRRSLGNAFLAYINETGETDALQKIDHYIFEGILMIYWYS